MYFELLFFFIKIFDEVLVWFVVIDDLRLFIGVLCVDFDGICYNVIVCVIIDLYDDLIVIGGERFKFLKRVIIVVLIYGCCIGGLIFVFIGVGEFIGCVGGL